MPGSYNFFKKEVKEHFLKSIRIDSNILDVGPGYGTYGNLLKPEYLNISAIEIWEPYINKIYWFYYVGY